MKKIDNGLLVVGVLCVLGAFVFIAFDKIMPRNNAGAPTPVPTKAVAAADFDSNVNDMPLLTKVLGNSQVIVPGTSIEVQLKNGSAIYENGDIYHMINLISLVGKNKTTDGSYDVFASMGDNMGGSGTFVYVGLFHVTPTAATYTSSSDFLGDRIIVKSATASAEMVNEYDLTVNYLDRTATESMADTPTVPQMREFPVKDHKIL